MPILAQHHRALSGLFPELCGQVPDLGSQAESVILRSLNGGTAALVEAVIAHYGIARVRAVAQQRVDWIERPAYRKWKATLALPVRDEMVERFQAMWRR